MRLRSTHRNGSGIKAAFVSAKGEQEHRASLNEGVDPLESGNRKPRRKEAE